jgi:hypothetical protein
MINLLNAYCDKAISKGYSMIDEHAQIRSNDVGIHAMAVGGRVVTA